MQDALGRRRDRGRIVRPALFHLPLILLSGQPLSGGAALPKGSGIRRADGEGNAARPLLRHGDDWPDDGRKSQAGHRRGDRASGGGGCEAQCCAQRDNECAVFLRGRGSGSPATRAGGRPAGCDRDRPTAQGLRGAADWDDRTNGAGAGGLCFL